MRNIVLIGFMATGKSSTGRLLANKLGCSFVDMDHKIEADEKMSIPQIFAEKGEEYFRNLEKNLVRELSRKKNLVISTGGGTVKDKDNIKLLKSGGFLVCLIAGVDIILERTASRAGRPLLDLPESERRAKIEALLEERKEFYAQADYTVDTSDMSPLQVVEDIVRHVKGMGI